MALFGALVLFLLAPRAEAAVWIVDGSPGSTLSDVLNDPSLADGDVVHVERGIHLLSGWTAPTLTVDLTLTGDGMGATRVVMTDSPAGAFLRLQADLRIADLTLDGFSTALVLSEPAGGELLSFDAEAVEIRDGGYGLTWPVAQGGLERFRFANGRLSNLSDAGMNLSPFRIDHAEVTGNVIEDVRGTAIRLGKDLSPEDSDHPWTRYLITGNQVRGLTSREGVNPPTARAIMAYGDNVTVSGNVVSDVWTTDPNGLDNVVGIYTKCRRCRVSDNVLRDVGPGFAIAIKGKNRTVLQENPGYSMIIESNQITVSDAPPGGHGAGFFYKGIKVSNEDVTVATNHLEGLTSDAIIVEQNARRNVALLHNLIVSSVRGIKIRGTVHDQFLVLGNRISDTVRPYVPDDGSTVLNGVCRDNQPADPLFCN